MQNWSYQLNQFSAGFNQGALNAGFGFARLANTMIHGVNAASPFRVYNLKDGSFNFSMGDTYHTINHWLNEKQSALNNRLFPGGHSDRLAFKLGHFTGNFLGDMAMFGGTWKLAKSNALSLQSKLALKEAQSIYWSPVKGPGPLSENVAKSFRSMTYKEYNAEESIVLYRVYGGRAKQLGSYWTRVPPLGPLQSKIDHALLAKWGNTAENIIKINVPRGTRIFEGVSSAQESLLGGGNQVFLQNVDTTWIVK